MRGLQGNVLALGFRVPFDRCAPPTELAEVYKKKGRLAAALREMVHWLSPDLSIVKRQAVTGGCSRVRVTFRLRISAKISLDIGSPPFVDWTRVSNSHESNPQVENKIPLTQAVAQRVPRERQR